MYFSKGKVLAILSITIISIVTSCDSFFREETKNEAIARVGDSFLYQEDVANAIPAGLKGRDSAAFVVNYINNWASKNILLEKSKINLPEDKLEQFDRLVSNYRKDLYTKAYLEALVRQSVDSVITTSEIQDFYEKEKENFKLTEKLVQLRFVALPNQFLDKDAIVQKIKDFKPEDKAYLDSIAVQFKKMHFNDSVWVSASRLGEEIPPLNALNNEKYLKKSQFFELQDSMEVYLGKVSNVLGSADIAPLSYITPDIKQIIINRRRLSQLKKIETEIIDEAIKNNEFEIYGKD